MAKKPPAIEHEFTIEHDGKQHTGVWTRQSDAVTVSSFYGSKSTQVGGSSPERVASWLLRELVIAAERG
jgi:hypothetical protein